MADKRSWYQTMTDYAAGKAGIAAAYAIGAGMNRKKKSEKSKKSTSKKGAPKKHEKQPFGYEAMRGMKRSRNRVEQAGRWSRGQE
jgi:hypothetical protein